MTSIINFILQMKILSLRIKNLSKVTELSESRLRYETQVSVAPQSMLHFPHPPPTLLLLPFLVTKSG